MATNSSGTAPHTAIVPGQGASAVTYTLPAGIYQYIESVVATVDTSGSGDVTAVLTVEDDSGTVIADKEQARAITAGGSGRATWALRLTDESGGGAPNGGKSKAQYVGNNVSIAPNFNADLTWDTLLVGDALLDISTPTAPTVIHAGIYAVTVWAMGVLGGVGESYTLWLRVDEAGDDAWSKMDVNYPGAAAEIYSQVTLVYFLPAGAVIRANVRMGSNGADRVAALREGTLQRLS